MNNQNITRILFILGAIGIIAVSILAVRQPSTVEPTPTPIPTMEPTATPEPEENTNRPVEHESEWRGYFVDGCVTEGGDESDCTCMWDWLRARYTIGEIADLAVRDDEATQLAIDGAVSACINPDNYGEE